jgi:hypothetical protein
MMLSLLPQQGGESLTVPGAVIYLRTKTRNGHTKHPGRRPKGREVDDEQWEPQPLLL